MVYTWSIIWFRNVNGQRKRTSCGRSSQTSARHATFRKRSLSDSQEDSKNMENRKKIFIHLYLTSSLSLKGANFLGSVFSIRKGNIHRDRISILTWSKNLDGMTKMRFRFWFYFLPKKRFWKVIFVKKRWEELQMLEEEMRGRNVNWCVQEINNDITKDIDWDIEETFPSLTCQSIRFFSEI